MIINYDKNAYKEGSSNRSLLIMEEPKIEDVTNIASNLYEDESMVRFPPMNEVMQTKRV
jgi:hypothetical protein